MNFFRKLERKFGRFAIPNLMYYIIFLYGAGLLLNITSPGFYEVYLSLNAEAILHGQIWRLVTFLICPPQSSQWFVLLAIYLYYSLGTTLERVWGTFRFNVFFFMGILGHILAAFLIYFITGISLPMSPYYLNESIFLAFAFTFPDMQFLFMFLLPIKAKHLGGFYAFLLLYSFLFGGILMKIEIGVSMLNLVVFFLMTRNYRALNPREMARRQNFKKEMGKAQVQKIALTHHRCAVCGRTEQDDPDLEFRYCSKCEGNLEYCMDHLYTHRHVTKEDLEEMKKNGAGK